MNVKILIAPVAFSMLLVSCFTNLGESQSAPSDSPSNSDETSPNKTGRLVFFSSTEANTALEAAPMPPLSETRPGNAAPTDPADKSLAELDRTNGVLNRCAGFEPSAIAPPKPQGQEMLPILAALGGWAISQVGSWLVSEVDTTLQNEVKKYTTTLSVQSNPFDFYKTLLQGKGVPRTVQENGVPKPLKAISCFRAQRREPKNPANPKSDPVVVMDFVGEVSLDSDHQEILTVQPVRLYYKQISSKNDNDSRVAVSMKLGTDVTWLGRTQGNLSKSVMDGILVSEAIDTKGVSADKPFYKVYDKTKSKSITVPLPPWNFEQSSISPQHNSMTVTLVESQVSNMPWLLKNAAALLNKNKDSVTKELVSEAQKAAGVN